MADEITTSQTNRISLDQFVETITASVLRAMDAREDEVSGYTTVPGRGGSLPPTFGRPPIVIGIIIQPPFRGQGQLAAQTAGVKALE